VAAPLMQQSRSPDQRANILLVDDQPAKLMSHELILAELDENLLKASSAKEALEILLKTDVAVILVDVCMPELDGFELARMIREHPRFEQTAIIFISAIHLSELDSLKGYEMGAVDYVSVPVVPGVLRAKVRVFVDLYRKGRELERLNNQLEDRVAERTAELEAAMVRQELLAREVDHRARNALAVIQAIVSMTPATSGREFAAAVHGRIQAMARAHTLLSETRWQGAELTRLMNEELEAYHSDDRVTVEGAAVLIKPTIAQNLALVIHELVTNAAKYGALAPGRGKLSVAWMLTEESLALHWVERCPQAIAKPERNGFGARVIASSISALEGSVEHDWRPTGLHFTLRLPSSHFEPPAAQNNAKVALVRNQARAAGQPLTGRTLLLVEDEPLIGLMMREILSDMGATVVGPLVSLPEAFGALSQPFDAALLDVNLAGEAVYPFAEELVRLHVPIIFLTGYESSSIDPRFASAPVLTKPIDAAELSDLLSTSIPSLAYA
jgi:two-component sensor histidine kinase/ActR/RegA family two-component response regulator